MKATRSERGRFWQVVDKDGPTMPHMDSPCWIFTMKAKTNGYGMFHCGGKVERAHRVSWYLTFGQTPTFLLHECDNRSCVNPAHLREGGHLQNARERVLRGRSAKGSAHGRAKLTEADIPQIDRLYWTECRPANAIADEYHVSRGSVTHAAFRRNWKQIPMVAEIKRKPRRLGRLRGSAEIAVEG